jgi:hypothetical protein
MYHRAKLVVSMGAVLFFAAMALGQQTSTETDPSREVPLGQRIVAYVYVSHAPNNSSTNAIAAYAAGADGKLTPLIGSPFQEDVSYMAVTGSYLFAADREKPSIDAYHIESDGSLVYSTATDYSKFNDYDCGGAGPLFLDHTGHSLYALEYNANACANNVYASFNIDKSDGHLEYLGQLNVGASSFGAPYLAPAFLGNNIYAYTATNSDSMYFETAGLMRTSRGVLTSNPKFHITFPAPPAGARVYIPQQAAADQENHVAFTLQPANPPGGNVGELRIASFTADANGALTTTNTSADMPRSRVSFANDLKMSPSGRLLAVAGEGGLQVFHFNGAHPATHYTGLLTNETITQMFWDDDNHLYAITESGVKSAPGKLFVFTITPTSYRQAPGSPYTIYNPAAIIVHSEPAP